ncbi:MAG: hypothetical protein OHK0045_01280 [Raineya sp.]
MKKANILTLAFIFAAATSTFAQTSAGTLFVGGGLGFSSSGSKTTTTIGGTTVTSDGPKATNLSFIPGVGYFIADKLAIGLDFSVTTGSDKETESNGDYTKTSATRIGIAPFARKYFMLSDNFGFIGAAGIGVGFGSSKEEERTGNTTVTTEGPKITTLEIGVVPGLVFFPTSKVGLEANFGFIGFASETSKEKTPLGETKTTTTNVGFGANTIRPTFSLGFRYYLSK